MAPPIALTKGWSPCRIEARIEVAHGEFVLLNRNARVGAKVRKASREVMPKKAKTIEGVGRGDEFELGGAFASGRGERRQTRLFIGPVISARNGSLDGFTRRYGMSTVHAQPPYILVNTRYGPMLANPNDVYIGQALIRYGEYGEQEVQFLRQWIDRAGVVIEVGANVGSHTVALAKCAARVAAQVIAFEPQPFVFQNLCANLALNGLDNVRAWPFACGRDSGTLWFDRPNYRQPGNFGAVSMQPTDAARGVQVPCVKLDEMIDAQSQVILLKLDVEGFELMALQGAVRLIERHRPVLYVENDRVEKSRELIEWLQSQQYRLWWHVCPLYNADNFIASSENVYGNVCSFNMIGLPREWGRGVADLEEIVDVGYHPLRNVG